MLNIMFIDWSCLITLSAIFGRFNDFTSLLVFHIILDQCGDQNFLGQLQ